MPLLDELYFPESKLCPPPSSSSLVLFRGPSCVARCNFPRVSQVTGIWSGLRWAGALSRSCSPGHTQCSVSEVVMAWLAFPIFHHLLWLSVTVRVYLSRVWFCLLECLPGTRILCIKFASVNTGCCEVQYVYFPLFHFPLLWFKDVQYSMESFPVMVSVRRLENS